MREKKKKKKRKRYNLTILQDIISQIQKQFISHDDDNNNNNNNNPIIALSENFNPG